MSGYVFWDTNLLIYWIEDAATWSGKVDALLRWQERHELKTITSSLALSELLVHPMRKKATELALSYARLIDEIGCLSFGADEAWRFAEIRSEYPAIRPPDAIQLACASVFGVEQFITNDDRLCQYQIKGIQRVIGLGSWTGAI